MAGILRRAATAYVRRVSSLELQKYTSLRQITTSKKNSEDEPAFTPYKDVVNPDKNWLSYGWDEDCKKTDRTETASTFFFTVSIGLVVGGFVLTYYPDLAMTDWAVREAYLELRRREELGLPLIDPNYIDPSLVILPSEEELGDEEIII